MPVRALKDVELADVGYHNQQSQLEGMLIHCVYDSVKIILLISIKLCMQISINAKVQIHM